MGGCSCSPVVFDKTAVQNYGPAHGRPVSFTIGSHLRGATCPGHSTCRRMSFGKKPSRSLTGSPAIKNAWQCCQFCRKSSQEKCALSSPSILHNKAKRSKQCCVIW